MKKHWLLLGMLASFVVSEPACKKHTDGAMPAACHSDMVIYRISMDQDPFLDQIEALRTGNVKNLASATDLITDWNNDGCQASTGLDAETVAKVGLITFYHQECAQVHMSKEDLEVLLEEAKQSEDPDDAQLYLLGRICLDINSGEHNNTTLPLIPSTGVTL